jgi:hypothetical protein
MKIRLLRSLLVLLTIATPISGCGFSNEQATPAIPAPGGAGESGTTPDPDSNVPPTLFYNLPPAILVTESGLYASPNLPDLITTGAIPTGQTLYVLGRNKSNSWLRAVWNTQVGWVPVSLTDLNSKGEQLGKLPVFEREPPRCVKYLTTQFSRNSTWTADFKERIAIVIDIFRSGYGDFPTSTLALTVNGTAVESSRRQIVEHGQFTLKDVVFSLPQKVQPGDIVGYQLDTGSNEQLTFVATIFMVPDDCTWDIH